MDKKKVYITGIGKNVTERREGDRDERKGIMNVNTKEIIPR
jgi:hypothetical protein